MCVLCFKPNVHIKPIFTPHNPQVGTLKFIDIVTDKIHNQMSHEYLLFSRFLCLMGDTRV